VVSSVQIISTYHSTIFNHIKNHRCHSLIIKTSTSAEISLGMAGSSRRQGRRRPVGAVVVDSIAFSFRHAAGRHGARLRRVETCWDSWDMTCQSCQHLPTYPTVVGGFGYCMVTYGVWYCIGPFPQLRFDVFHFLPLFELTLEIDWYCNDIVQPDWNHQYLVSAGPMWSAALSAIEAALMLNEYWQSKENGRKSNPSISLNQSSININFNPLARLRTWTDCPRNSWTTQPSVLGCSLGALLCCVSMRLAYLMPSWVATCGYLSHAFPKNFQGFFMDID
jgi:hypothetical protein